MAFKVIVSLRAQKEIENAIDFYLLYIVDAPANFVSALKFAYQALGKDPHLRLRYKNVRALKIKKFPYSLYFIVNEEKKQSGFCPAFTRSEIPRKDLEFETKYHRAGLDFSRKLVLNFEKNKSDDFLPEHSIGHQNFNTHRPPLPSPSQTKPQGVV